MNGQHTHQSSKCFHLLTGNVKIPFVLPVHCCIALSSAFKYVQKILISIKFAEFTVEGHRELSAWLTSAPLLVQTCSTRSACCWTAHPGTSQTTRWRISYSSSPNVNKRTSSKCDHWSKRHGLISFFVLSYYQPSKREIINTVTLNYITISCSSYLYCFYFLKLNEELSPVSLGSQRDLVFILSRYTWASAEWWFVL